MKIDLLYILLRAIQCQRFVGYIIVSESRFVLWSFLFANKVDQSDDRIE